MAYHIIWLIPDSEPGKQDVTVLDKEMYFALLLLLLFWREPA